MVANTNAGTGAAPAFRCYLNLMALDALPADSTGPRGGEFRQTLEQIKSAGYQGVQFTRAATEAELQACGELGLGIANSGRVNLPEEAGALAAQFSGAGFECATLHVGWGMEDDDVAHRLIEAIVRASETRRIPLYVETHRATIFQDMWRTVQFAKRFPDLRFNGDFSHWYTGQEMVYGGFDTKFAFIQPVIERVRFIHGRIGNPGCMQVRIEDAPAEEETYVTHFKQLWAACFEQFLKAAAPGDYICFTPELLAPQIYYARAFPNAAGEVKEESDRWQQSLILRRIAEECFRAAQAAVQPAEISS